MAAINKWHSRQLNFIQAYPQALIRYDLYMELLKGYKTKEGDARTHVLQLLKNIYGQNEVRGVWNHNLNNALRQFDFKQSTGDECGWYKYETIFFYYVDDSIFIGPDSIDRVINEIEKAWLYIEDKGNI